MLQKYPKRFTQLLNKGVCIINISGLGGLVVSMMASGTRVRGFKPG
jgi:hypothetical protein